MLKIPARTLSAMPEEEIWALQNGNIEIAFDDGILVARTRQTIISWYFWEIHRVYPTTPLLIRHHMGNGFMGSDTHLKQLGIVAKDCFDSYAHVDANADQERLSKLIYEITNRIYNETTRRLSAYVTSIGIMDFLEVLEHKEIREVNRAVAMGNLDANTDITMCYNRITKVLKDPKELVENPISKAVKFGLLRMGQVLQCVGPRGFPTDIDSNTFRTPIATGFAQGIRTLEDMMKESRSAAKALVHQQKPMEMSEYFNRNMQLGVQTLKNLYPGDCGSTATIPFVIVPGFQGTLGYLEGINYIEDGVVKQFRGDEREMLGKVVQIRSVFTCMHPDPYGICSVCFGAMSRAFPKGTNVAHFSCTQILAVITQHVLSTKHEDTSSTIDVIVINDSDRKIIEHGSDPNKLRFTRNFNLSKATMIIPGTCALSLQDIVRVENVKTLTTSRISQLAIITLAVTRGKVESLSEITVAQGQRLSSLTHDALAYIKRVGWRMAENGDYMVDLSQWPREKDLLELPLKQYNMTDFLKAVEHTIKSGSSKTGTKAISLKKITDYETPEEALAGLHELISSKMSVNLSHLQLILLANMVESVKDRNYNLPVAGHIGKFAAYRNTMALRSLSAAMAYERQSMTMLRLDSYLIRDRPEHPLDPLLVP